MGQSDRGVHTLSHYNTVPFLAALHPSEVFFCSHQKKENEIRPLFIPVTRAYRMQSHNPFFVVIWNMVLSGRLCSKVSVGTGVWEIRSVKVFFSVAEWGRSAIINKEISIIFPRLYRMRFEQNEKADADPVLQLKQWKECWVFQQRPCQHQLLQSINNPTLMRCEQSVRTLHPHYINLALC